MNDATLLVRCDASPDDPCRPTAPPLYQTATFAQPGALVSGRFDYTRSGNPTREALERQVAALERGHRGFAFASGMAALAAALRLVPAGDAVVAGDDLYGGSWRLLDRLARRHQVQVRYADASDPEAFACALCERTRLVLVETPTNPFQRVADLRALAALTRPRGILLAVDGSMTTPLLQRPLELGADLVLHSATKYLGGHGDLTAGIVVARDPAIADELAFVQNAEGAGLAPFECWLLARGLKTLAVRLERQQATAGRLARRLAAHPAISRVHYVGLPSHPGYEVHAAQARGAGAVLSFETGSAGRSAAIVDALRLFTIAVSFGSVSSTASLPCRMSHASIPEAVRRARAFPDDLVRLSIGLEDPADLEADLVQALDAAAGVTA